ncbi:MAG: hypothetical protein KDI15_09165, partial [Thiothrix sp.]|nr:hypothetical protein [Thiothrix sp.]
LDERFWPVQNLVGIRPLFRNDRTENNAEARFEIVRTNAEGQLQGGEKLSATLIREDYEYYWEYNDQEGWKRQEVRNEYPVTRQPLVLTAGQKGEVAFRVGYGRYRLEVEDGDTQLKAVYGFSAGWVGAEDGLATRPDQIELKLDKATYREGDTARLTIRPPAAGEAVVAIESDRLLWSQPLSLALEGTEIEIPVGTGSDWARHDLYVSVVSFRPADRSEKIAPNRSLGLIHLPLDRSDRRMALSISAPEKTLPEKPVIVSVQAKGLEGQKAILTLSAVDAGVLNITRFKTPDPFGYYFDREAYDVDIHDDYGKIIESVDGKALRQRFGGDAPVGLAGGALARADVQIVSLFRGAVEFDPEGRADIELTLPGFDGQLRLMAVAASETRFGSAERDMTVASPVVVSLAGPRFLANGDSSFVTVEMRNTGETEQKVVLKVKANDLLEFVPTDQAYTLQKGQREVLRLPLAAHRSFGVGNLQLQLAGSDFVANRFLNLALRPAYPARREDFRYELQGDAIQPVPSALVKPYLPESLRARLTIAPTPVLPVANALDGLLHYPYGCLEQTASSAYPYLFLELEDAERWGFSPINMQERNERVQAALVRLAGMQLSEGDFTMWGGYGASESWLTPYVADFLVSARRQGFPVPDRMYDQVMAYLERRMQEGHRGELYGYSDDPEHLGFASRAYGAYVLARENRAVLGTLRSMYQQDVSKARTGLPLVHLGLALALQGDGAKGEELINKGLAMVRKPDLYLGDYGSPVRDKAMMLYQLLSNKRQVPALGEQVNALSRSIFERDYLSTQEQAFIFLLGNQLARQSAESWQARLKIGENFIDLKRNGVYVQGLTAADISAGVSLISTQDQPLYASLVLDGYPVDAPAPRSKPVAV